MSTKIKGEDRHILVLIGLKIGADGRLEHKVLGSQEIDPTVSGD